MTMNKIMPMLASDFYKQSHQAQFPPEITKLVSYMTPRMSRVHDDHLVFFGLQAFIKEYLIEYFNNEFFNKPADEVCAEYERVLSNTLGKGTYSVEKIRALHNLGYLPVKICALPEGTRVPMHVPMLEISSTHPDFPWVGQFLESLMSAYLWHPMISANVGYWYRQIVDRYYAISVDDDVPRAKALGDFSFRGQHSLESAVTSSAGWCLSFLNSATVPVIPFLEHTYNCDCAKEPVAYGAVSTEHAVMTSNFAIDGDEITFLRKLLTELYPDTSFSVVSDSYDYWNVVKNILPQLRKEIMEHNGCMLIRGDSGDPVTVVTDTVFALWKEFGGTVNSKGFKVLDPHVKAIYGDSITPQRCEQIYQILIANGFACNNVALGVGSFSMMCLEEDNMLKPFTRDTYSIAIKATYGECNGEPIMIFKDPKTDRDTGKGFKKSQRGLCYVYEEDGEIKFKDGYTSADIPDGNMLEPVFENGKFVKEYTLNDVRQRLYGGNF